LRVEAVVYKLLKILRHNNVVEYNFYVSLFTVQEAHSLLGFLTH